MPEYQYSECCPPWQGEVDVILDLITFVEQQQFLGLALLPGKKRTPEEFARDRALGLAHRKDQLKVRGPASK